VQYSMHKVHQTNFELDSLSEFYLFSSTTDCQHCRPHIPWPSTPIYISICSVQQLTVNFDTHILHDLQSLLTLLFVQFNNWRVNFAAHIFHDLQPLSTFLFVQFNNWWSTLPPTYCMTYNYYIHFYLFS